MKKKRKKKNEEEEKKCCWSESVNKKERKKEKERRRKRCALCDFFLTVGPNYVCLFTKMPWKLDFHNLKTPKMCFQFP